MSNFPKSLERILMEYQVTLENWVKQATAEEVKELLLAGIGWVYPDDWSDFAQRYQKDSSFKSAIKETTTDMALLAVTTIAVDNPDRDDLHKLLQEIGCDVTPPTVLNLSPDVFRSLRSALRVLAREK